MSAVAIQTSQATAYLKQQVELHGHVQTIRRLGNNLAFLLIRDKAGTLQSVIDSPSVLAALDQINLESPVIVRGQVVAHEQSKQLELKVEEILHLSAPSPGLPIEIGKENKMTSLSLNAMLDYRPLTLRNEKVRAIFKIEAELCRAFRAYLSEKGFTEIHSPKIVATGTEGGAALFSVEYFGKQAYLAQSPQFYKQIMVGVFERVFEIGPVYRAEEHDTTRHLNEYISMDFEMGFIESEQDLIEMQTGLLSHMFSHLAQTCVRELELFGASVPVFKEIPQIELAAACELLRTKYSWSPAQGTADLDPEGERLLCQHFARQTDSPLVYVTRYPWSVRPFYAMPLAGTALSASFDLLFAGLEITTGGQRIHEYEELCSAIRSRGLEPESFADYLQCFRYGMPPHGGLAIGLERLAKQLLNLPNVKLASLFPRDRNRITP